MTYLKKLIISAFCVFLSSGLCVAKQNLENKFRGAVLGSALGDALGRVTERKKSYEAIDSVYPNDVRSVDDFVNADWKKIPKKYRDKKIAIYTDDTRMSKVVMKSLLESAEYQTGHVEQVSDHGDWTTVHYDNYYALSFFHTMSILAHAFVDDMNNAKNEWRWCYYGKACQKYCRDLEKKIRSNNIMRDGMVPYHDPNHVEGTMFIGAVSAGKNWWAVANSGSGGSGSVMRAYPFGLIFMHDPEKAKTWSAEHSMMTHDAPMAKAACAAMAVGVAYALQNKSVDYITEQMIVAAQEYDQATAQEMQKWIEYAHQARTLYDAAHCTAEYKQFSRSLLTSKIGWDARSAIAAATYLFVLFSDDLLSAIYTGVNIPGDSDSIAAMAGALVGAYNGDRQLPYKIISRVEDYKELKDLASKMYECNKSLRADKIRVID